MPWGCSVKSTKHCRHPYWMEEIDQLHASAAVPGKEPSYSVCRNCGCVPEPVWELNRRFGKLSWPLDTWSLKWGYSSLLFATLRSQGGLHSVQYIRNLKQWQGPRDAYIGGHDSVGKTVTVGVGVAFVLFLPAVSELSCTVVSFINRKLVVKERLCFRRVHIGAKVVI
jgi:hypothetical protein